MTDRRSTPAAQQGRNAPSPWAIPPGGWWAALKRTQKEMGDDNVGLIAAGTAFYAFSSIIPILAAVVLSYGLFADPQTVQEHLQALFSSLPQDAASIIGDQLRTVVQTNGGKKGIGLLIALALALYGGTKATSAVVTALNIAYEEKETRGVVKLYLLYFVMVIGAVLLVLGAILATTMLAFIDDLLPNLGGFGVLAIRLLSYAVIAALAVTAGACLYRYGPDRADAKWAWLTPGSAIATVLWLAGTALFGLYVSNFGNYGATYGSLSAVIVLLTWLWLSAYVYLFGAELNSELERQTARDTTTGAERPMGARGATSADTVAEQGSARPGAAEKGLGDASGGDRSPGLASTAVGIRAASRVTGHKAGLLPTLLAAAGLSRLGKGGRGAGSALLVAGAALAWIGREKPKPKRKDGRAARP